MVNRPFSVWQNKQGGRAHRLPPSFPGIGLLPPFSPGAKVLPWSSLSGPLPLKGKRTRDSWGELVIWESAQGAVGEGESDSNPARWKGLGPCARRGLLGAQGCLGHRAH